MICLSHLIPAVLAAMPLFAQPFPAVKGGDVWLTKDIKWQKAPRKVNRHLSSGLATILYFRTDGGFGLMHCRVNKGLDYLVVSNGDGQVVYTGQWELNGNDGVVRYRLIERTILVRGEQIPGPWQTAVIHGNAITKRSRTGLELRLDNKTFTPMGGRLAAKELDPEFFRFGDAVGTAPSKDNSLN